MSRGKPAVVAGLSGGLGNQMFQYATGRALSLRLGLPLTLDLSWFSGRRDRFYALSPFAIKATLAGDAGPRGTMQRPWHLFLNRVRHRLAWRQMGVPVFRERFFHFDPSFLELSRPVYLDGYWQSERYFSDVHDVIASDFSLSRAMSPKSNEMLALIAASDAICVHIRRGDYVSNPVANATHGLCQLDYYQQGVQSSLDGMRSPHCFIFSDDSEWVRSNLHLPVDCTIVDFNTDDTAHEDLLLMAACKRFVLANSSFSWWGAWLCEHQDKRVIAPKKWFQDERKNTCDLIPARWKKL